MDENPMVSMSRTETAMRVVAVAVERLRRLEADADRAFAEFTAARDQAEEVGVPIDVQLTPGISAAFSAWKQERNREVAHTVVSAEFGRRS